MDDYEYELRREGVVIATGRIQLEDPPSPGETLTLGPHDARVADVLNLGRARRLILAV